MADLSAAILAGGRATRFGGANKALLRVGGVRIVDRLVAALEPVAQDLFIVAPDAAAYADLGLRVVGDVIPGAGSLGGIYTAIVESRCPRTIVVACDMPFITTELLQALVAVEPTDVVLPRTAQGYEPLCAVYAKSCGPVFRDRIMRGELRVAAAREALRVAEIGPETLAAFDREGRLFANVNTPHDYERAKGQIELKPDPTQDRITD